MDFEELVQRATDTADLPCGVVYALLAIAETQNTLIGLHPSNDATYEILDSIKTILDRIERKL